jgi:hypothetical protein
VPGDAEGLFAIRSDEETMKFFGHEPHVTLDETKDVVRQMEERYVRKAALHWVITLQCKRQGKSGSSYAMRNETGAAYDPLIH